MTTWHCMPTVSSDSECIIFDNFLKNISLISSIGNLYIHYLLCFSHTKTSGTKSVMVIQDKELKYGHRTQL